MSHHKEEESPLGSGDTPKSMHQGERLRRDRILAFIDRDDEDMILITKKGSAATLDLITTKATTSTISAVTTTRVKPTKDHSLFVSDADDEFIVVSKKPTIDLTKSGMQQNSSGNGRRTWWSCSSRTIPTSVALVVALLFLLALGLLSLLIFQWYFRFRRRKCQVAFETETNITATAKVSRNQASSSSSSSSNVRPESAPFSPTKAMIETNVNGDDGESSREEAESTTSEAIPLENTKSDFIASSPAIPSLRKEHADPKAPSDDPKKSYSPQQQEAKTEEQSMHVQGNSIVTSTKTPPSSLSDDVRQQQQQQQQSIQTAANQLAHDIKLVEQVFQERGLDASLASQVAVTLHSTRHLVVERERLEMQRFMVETHQKHLERQLSIQQQHQHQLQQEANINGHAAALYDANWKDKLRDRRDKCWNAACRLISEIALAHVAVKLAKPILHLVYPSSSQTTNDPYYGSLSSTSRIVQFLLTKICNCNDPQSSLSSPPLILQGSFLGDSSWRFYSYAALMFTGWELEQGVCYGYCVFSLGAISMVALVLHQLLRAFSAPTLLHHVINATALLLVYGGPIPNPRDWMHSIWKERPDLVLLVVASMMGMLAVVQWNYQTYRRRITKCSPKDFRTLWDECLDTMDALYFQITVTRYAALAIACSILWIHTAGQSGDDDIDIDIDSSLVIRGDETVAIYRS